MLNGNSDVKPSRGNHISWIVIVALSVLAVAATCTLYKGHSSGQRDVSQAQLLEWMKQKSTLCILDVRTAGEYSSGHIPGAVNIGYKEISAHLDELAVNKDKNIVVYCEAGGRARMAQSDLTKAGFPNVYHLTGDMSAWRNAGQATEK